MLVADNSAHLPIYFKTPCFINITFKMSPKSSLNSKSKHFLSYFWPWIVRHDIGCNIGNNVLFILIANIMEHLPFVKHSF